MSLLASACLLLAGIPWSVGEDSRVAEATAPDAAEALRLRVELIVQRWSKEAVRRSRGKIQPGLTKVSVVAWDSGAGKAILRLNADRPMRPASNMKLVTTAAALAVLGSGWEFETQVYGTGPLTHGKLDGDLVIKGGGDPLCDLDGRGRVENRLLDLAHELHDLGLRSIRGDLVLDAGVFPEPAPGPAWPDPSQHWSEYCALAAGLSLNGGVLVAEVTPGERGKQARIQVHPSPHGLKRRYGVLTSPGKGMDVRVGATLAAVTVKGSIPPGYGSYRASFSHPDPVGLFGSAFDSALARVGIRRGGKIVRGPRSGLGKPLAVMKSPVSTLLAPINRDSRNSIADHLFLATGLVEEGRATRAAGQAATRRVLVSMGIPGEGLIQVDGSGLSRENRVSARQLVSLIVGVLGDGADAGGQAFLDSLALAGSSGTLAGRLKGTIAEGRLRAKTGWIRGVSALSGATRTLSGGVVIFSILVEYPPNAAGMNSACFKPMQDEIALCFVEYEG